MSYIIKKKTNPIINQKDYLLNTEDANGLAISLYSPSDHKNIDLLFILSFFDEENIKMDILLKALFYTISKEKIKGECIEDLLQLAKIFSQEPEIDPKSPTVSIDRLKTKDFEYRGNYASLVTYCSETLEPSLNDIIGKENFIKMLKGTKEEEKNVIIYQEKINSSPVPLASNKKTEHKQDVIGIDDFFIGEDECLAISLIGLESSSLIENVKGKSVVPAEEQIMPEETLIQRNEDMIFSDKRFIGSDIRLTNSRREELSNEIKTRKIKIYGLE